MKRRQSIFGGLSILILITLIAMTIASASTGTLPADEIDAIVNTTTDASLVSSPFTNVVNSVRNSIVGVNNYTTVQSSYGYGFGYGFGGGGRSEPRESLSSTGSGVAISNYGHILTNYHVVEGATRVTITMAGDESEHSAEVVGYDADLDIAILLVPGLKIDAVPLGDSDVLQVGEWAIVIGNPLGEEFARTVTVGVVSALDREITDTSYDRYGRASKITNTMIQVDAAINSGNSGGGMFNVLGQLQGVPARKYSAGMYYSGASIDNIGMCIPINVAKPLIKEVLSAYNADDAAKAAEKTAPTPGGAKPRLGVTVGSTTSSMSSKLPLGAIVRNVEVGSPAEEGGLQVGDVIVEIDGEIIAGSQALVDKIDDYKEGDVIALKVFRAEGIADAISENSIDMSKIGDGEYIDLTVTLRVIEDQKSSASKNG